MPLYPTQEAQVSCEPCVRSRVVFAVSCAAQGSMVQDMFQILDVQHRFLPAYGLSRAGTKLAPVAAQRARIALSRTSEAAAKARVDAELHSRGGFIPLMGHFPVMRFAAAGQQASGAAQEAVADADGPGAEAAADSVEQQAAAGPLQQAADGAQAAAAAAAAGGLQPAAPSSGIQFSDSDKRLFVYMQQWFQKHKAAAGRKRKRLKVAAAAAAAAGADGAADAEAGEQPPLQLVGQ